MTPRDLLELNPKTEKTKLTMTGLSKNLIHTRSFSQKNFSYKEILIKKKKADQPLSALRDLNKSQNKSEAGNSRGYKTVASIKLDLLVSRENMKKDIFPKRKNHSFMRRHNSNYNILRKSINGSQKEGLFFRGKSKVRINSRKNNVREQRGSANSVFSKNSQNSYFYNEQEILNDFNPFRSQHSSYVKTQS